MKKKALKSDWKNSALSNVSKKINIDFKFNKEQYENLKLGLIPEQMEDKWFIYFENNFLYFHRSWTGICIYKMHLVSKGDKYISDYFFAVRDDKLYTNKDDKEDIRILTFLIKCGLLQIDMDENEIITDTEKNPLIDWSNFGRMIFK